MTRRSAPALVVVGSLNMDFTARVERLPAPGETVMARDLTKRFGGKGGNQAVAAARQGAQVTFVGQLGEDPDGRDYRNHLRREGINCSCLNTAREVTGCAHITVDDQGENQIVVIGGANAMMNGPMVKMQRPRFAAANLLLLQMELPQDCVLAAIALANELRVPVMLNASPLIRNFPWDKVRVEVLVVNDVEARGLLGLEAGVDLKAEAVAHARAMRKLGLSCVVVTRGSDSTLIWNEEGCFEVGTLEVAAVDTVGAGDVFAGVLAVHHAEGAGLQQAVRWANAAAALSTLKAGAQEAIPHRGDVQHHLGLQDQD
jgi:ribokinase